jgi:hypothetical protein
MPKEWDDSIIELAFHEKYELLLQAKTIAGLVFQVATEHEWLERKFAVYKDIIKRSGSREERALSKSDEGTKGNATNQEGNGCEKHRAQQYSAGGVL